MSAWKVFVRGLWEEVPVFRLLLGLCPTLAVTTSLVNGLGMGLATTFVLIGSNVVVSMLRKAIPGKIRIPAFIVVIASFVTVVDLLMHGYTPVLHKALGIFIPLIVVNCIILYRAESFAYHSRVLHSLMDALGIGLGFALAIMLIAGVREVLGSGTIWGYPWVPVSLPVRYVPASILIQAPGAFIVLGLLMAFFNWMGMRRRAQR